MAVERVSVLRRTDREDRLVVSEAITFPFTRPQAARTVRCHPVDRVAVAAMGAFPAAYVANRQQRFTEADHHLHQWAGLHRPDGR